MLHDHFGCRMQAVPAHQRWPTYHTILLQFIESTNSTEIYNFILIFCRALKVLPVLILLLSSGQGFQGHLEYLPQ